MNLSRPYLRAFVFSAILFSAVAYRMASRSGLNEFKIVTLLVAWVVTSLLTGLITTKLPRWRSWWGVGVITVGCCFLTLWVMLAMSPKGPTLPHFETTGEFMAYAANDAIKWVKEDRKIELDYSSASIEAIEEALDRLSKSIPRDNPPPGTFGQAIAYGAYVGEVLRRKHGGRWEENRSTGEKPSYSLTIKSNVVIFPIRWCWERVIDGNADNVYHKFQLFESTGSLDSLRKNRMDDSTSTNHPLAKQQSDQ